MRQTDNRHIDPLCERPLVKAVRKAVLIIHIDFLHRENTQHRLISEIFQHFKARFQNLHIPPELIDHDTTETILVLLRKKLDSAIGRSKHAAPVNVRHQDHRCVCHLGHSHIDDIIFRQIDLCRRTGSLYDDDIIFIGQMPESLHHLRCQVVFDLVIILGAQVIIYLAVYNDLRTHIAGGF